MTTETASCAMELPAREVPEWVHLLPKGSFSGRDGRAWKLSNPKGLLAGFAANAMDLPIDYEHQTENAEKNGQPAPAAGWIKAVAARPDGIWGRVEWTAKAREMLTAREYRFLSPVFVFNNQNKEVLRLVGAGLTNRPNLLLTALARQETPSMDDNLKAQLKEILGLPGTASDDDIISLCKVSTAPDPSRYVPVDQVAVMVEELASLKANMTEEKAVNTVDNAVRSFQLPPALRDWGIALCHQNPKAFQEFLDKAGGAYAHLGKTSIVGQIPPRTSAALGAEEQAVCRNLGISEDDLRATLSKS